MSSPRYSITEDAVMKMADAEEGGCVIYIVSNDPELTEEYAAMMEEALGSENCEDSRAAQEDTVARTLNEGG